MQLTAEQRVFIAKQYYSSGSPTEVKREFATEYIRDINIINKCYKFVIISPQGP